MLKSFLRSIGVAIALFAFAPPASAQQTGGEAPPPVDRSATGGAQTLEDILRRQRGEEVPLDQGDAGPAALPDAAPGALATQGGASDAAFWRGVRQGKGETFTVSIPDKKAARLVQDDGETWLATRNGPLLKYSFWALGGMLAALFLFFLIRGRIRVEGGLSGIMIKRFKFIERFGHWLLGISFIILALTGLSVLAGREGLIPALDWANGLINGAEADPNYGQGVFKDYFVPWLGIAKLMHNSVAWAFMLGLVMIFFMWVLRNIPTWTDVIWLLKGGGIIGSAHVSARKFNAGQKIIFWLVILLGASVSASGLMLLFPYEVPLFSETFETVNVVSERIGRPMELETSLTPIQEQQFAQLWHTIIGVAMTVVVLAHVYVGSIGMQGAISAMGSGEVDLNWAEEHHDLWVEQLRRKGELADRDEGVVHARNARYEPAE